ncbi:MAG: SIS domain-containing protein [Planctomycetota bacterium]|jgi:glucosamine--fructose-6-phosphate aminotransferase (isomerizing)
MKNEEKYTKFALVREMMESPEIIRRFNLKDTENAAEQIKQTGKVLFSGEGSSRMFPSKNAIAWAMKAGIGVELVTEGSYQAGEYDLSGFVVFAASNSGRTKETVSLFDKLRKAGHKRLFGLKLQELSNQTFIISCGKEDAFAATKSCIEQALFYQSLLAQVQGKSFSDKLNALANAFEDALTVLVDPAITEAVAGAETVYLAGRNDGVAEELSVKVNEIVRKKSGFLEGTSYMHGAQEVMKANDVVILIDPYKSELEKTKEILIEEAGLKVFAVATEETIFPTVKVKEVDGLTNYLFIAAGWNILVEAGISLSINLDEAERARKVGNVFIDQKAS